MQVLFLCRGNSLRTALAEIYYNTYAKTSRAVSAGIDAKESFSPSFQTLLKEQNLDLLKHKPTQLTDDLVKQSDIIVVFGDASRFQNEKKKILYWDVPKPETPDMEKLRTMSALIQTKVKDLLDVIER